jgi:hypothetical protein
MNVDHLINKAGKQPPRRIPANPASKATGGNRRTKKKKATSAAQGVVEAEFFSQITDAFDAGDDDEDMGDGGLSEDQIKEREFSSFFDG